MHDYLLAVLVGITIEVFMLLLKEILLHLKKTF